VTLLATVRQLWPDHFAWSDPPYEYEVTKPPIDILSGSTRLRLAFADEVSPNSERLLMLMDVDESAWWREAEPYLLYQ
jgi:hypothetical protein